MSKAYHSLPIYGIRKMIYICIIDCLINPVFSYSIASMLEVKLSINNVWLPFIGGLLFVVMGLVLILELLPSAENAAETDCLALS